MPNDLPERDGDEVTRPFAVVDPIVLPCVSWYADSQADIAYSYLI
jgi:hypothetical protein